MALELALERMAKDMQGSTHDRDFGGLEIGEFPCIFGRICQARVRYSLCPSGEGKVLAKIPEKPGLDPEDGDGPTLPVKFTKEGGNDPPLADATVASTPSTAGDNTQAYVMPSLDPFMALPLDHPRYRILALLGAGGMGAVYKAEHGS